MGDPKKVTRKVFLFGEGALQLPSAASSGSGGEASSAAAAGVGFGYQGPWLQLMGSLRKGSNKTVEAVTNDDGTVDNPSSASIGNSIFSPQTSDSNFLLNAGIYPWELSTELPMKGRFGFYGYANAGGYSWQFRHVDAAAQESIRSVDAQLFGYGIGPALRWSGYKETNDFSADVKVGYAARIIGGDVENHKDVRRQLLDTDVRYFHGPEVMLSASLGGLTFGVSITYFFPSKKDSDSQDNEASKVDGLTGLRFTPMVMAVAPLTLGSWDTPESKGVE